MDRDPSATPPDATDGSVDRSAAGSAPRGEAPAESLQDRFRERFEALLPLIQKEWPELARHTLEASRGSLDDLSAVIADHTGRTAAAVRHQLEDLLHLASDQGRHLADHLDPLERQLENLLDELNATLRPRLEKPVRQRPLLAVGLAAGVGLLVGLLLASGRRSA
ncbi:MAG: hypothetical protein VKJ66_03270 [Synechococcus sp.]|nr:hypothetical protein [Synechococcus sp.]